MKFQPLPKVFPEQQMWEAEGKKGTYIIMKDVGFTASIKRLGITKYLIEFDSPVASFEEAEAVCEKNENPTQ